MTIINARSCLIALGVSVVVSIGFANQAPTRKHRGKRP